MKLNTALTHPLKPLITVFAVLALLVQCLGMLTEIANKSSVTFSGSSPESSVVFSAHGPEPEGRHHQLEYAGGTFDQSSPVMSCCDDESQPITLAELQLLPLIFLLGLFAVVLRITRNIKPKSPFLSPRIRLHKLHCCWLN